MKIRYALGAALLLAASAALAAPKVSGLSAKQVGPLEVLVTVTIDRPTPIDLLCDTNVSLGDGTTKPLNFGAGDKHQKTLQYKYAKGGTYKVTAKGTGRCEGSREATVAVNGGASGKKAAEAKPEKKVAAKTHCPRGWKVVAGSEKDGRYVCHANPPAKPIKCEGGATYFSENGVIGCR